MGNTVNAYQLFLSLKWDFPGGLEVVGGGLTKISHYLMKKKKISSSVFDTYLGLY